jgi:S1-C subfamily serine protease
MRRAGPALTLLALVSLGAAGDAHAQPDALSPEIVSRLAEVLADRRVEGEPAVTTRSGLGDLYRVAVRSVPLVVTRRSIGSSVVIVVKQAESRAWVITNDHVVDEPFTVDGRRVAALVFYDREMKDADYNHARLLSCLGNKSEQGAWCLAARRSTRLAGIVATDPSKDLALLEVTNIPPGLVGIAPAGIDSIQPGDPIAVIGHPHGLLWSLTTGIVSAVRHNFRVGASEPDFGTVIQTQAPTNPGNSGGPMLGGDGRLVGVVFGGRLADRIMGAMPGKPGTTKEVAIAAPGLNFGVGINEVLTFTQGHLR